MKRRVRVAPVQSIAIRSACHDNSHIEFNFRGERYLPCEGAGAINRCQLEMPTEFRQFDRVQYLIAFRH